LDDFNDCARFTLWWLRCDRSCIAEIFEQRAIETIEHSEMRFIWEPITFACAATEHLLEEDARFYWTQEYDKFEIGNVYSRREHIYGYDDCRVLAIAKLPDSLKGPIN